MNKVWHHTLGTSVDRIGVNIAYRWYLMHIWFYRIILFLWNYTGLQLILEPKPTLEGLRYSYSLSPTTVFVLWALNLYLILFTPLWESEAPKIWTLKEKTNKNENTFKTVRFLCSEFLDPSQCLRPFFEKRKGWYMQNLHRISILKVTAKHFFTHFFMCLLLNYSWWDL